MKIHDYLITVETPSKGTSTFRLGDVPVDSPEGMARLEKAVRAFYGRKAVLAFVTRMKFKQQPVKQRMKFKQKPVKQAAAVYAPVSRQLRYPVRVMVTAEGYAMVRRRGAGPHIVPVKDLQPVPPPGVPCEHPGCLSHVTHPCEGCGRTAGRRLRPED